MESSEPPLTERTSSGHLVRSRAWLAAARTASLDLAARHPSSPAFQVRDDIEHILSCFCMIRAWISGLLRGARGDLPCRLLYIKRQEGTADVAWFWATCTLHISKRVDPHPMCQICCVLKHA